MGPLTQPEKDRVSGLLGTIFLLSALRQAFRSRSWPFGQIRLELALFKYDRVIPVAVGGSKGVADFDGLWRLLEVGGLSGVPQMVGGGHQVRAGYFQIAVTKCLVRLKVVVMRRRLADACANALSSFLAKTGLPLFSMPEKSIKSSRRRWKSLRPSLCSHDPVRIGARKLPCQFRHSQTFLPWRDSIRGPCAAIREKSKRNGFDQSSSM